MPLVLDNLACQRAERLLFSGLGICLAPGSLLIVKGPNGCGKTSLLQQIAGLLPLADGEIRWGDAPTENNPDFLRELSYIGHRGGVKQELTVRQNLEFSAKMHRAEMLLDAAMHYFQLTPLADMRVATLSAGWQRRVALARLILSRAQLWLLDEPTNFLDDEAVALVTALIETRVTQGGIVIAASHTMGSSLPGHTLHLKDYAC